MKSDPKIIVALDSEDKTELQKIIEKLDPKQCRLKIGKTLFTQYGPQWIKELQSRGFDIFLDLKFHDIPQQVKGACKAAAELGAWMINVHALGGIKMLKAAVEGVAQANTAKKPKLIGVTLLTSLGDSDLQTLGFQGKVEDAVMRLATLCHEAGLDGVVCSAQEATMLKKAFGKEFLCITPGIRLANEQTHDQLRVMTPEKAIACGSDYLVIGRSITGATSPFQVLTQIQQSLSAA